MDLIDDPQLSQLCLQMLADACRLGTEVSELCLAPSCPPKKPSGTSIEETPSYKPYTAFARQRLLAIGYFTLLHCCSGRFSPGTAEL